MTAADSTSGPRGDWREGLPPEVADRASLPLVRAVRHDSRAVEPGDLFVCIPGERHDGHAFAAAAVAAGAAALVVQRGHEALHGVEGVPVVAVEDPRAALSSIAAAHEGYPAERLTVIGVTGTDGKSTTSFLTLAALEGNGLRAGVLSTVESRIAGRAVPNPTRLTTPEAPAVQRLLAEMVDAGCTHAVVEATSHGLALHRLDHCAFDVAVMTNLTPDHLDFHGSLEAYAAAKARLFAALDAPSSKHIERAAVLNADDPASATFRAATEARGLYYGIDEAGTRADLDLAARQLALGAAGSRFIAATADAEVHAEVPLPGRFNVANAAAALTVALALGLDLQAAGRGIARSSGVPGRMERVPGPPSMPFEVIVDYAHTPDAMEQVLRTLRPVVAGRLIVVFGCAGERSRDRRTGLGAVVARLADYAVLTEEDPRSEPSEAIIDDIAQAMLRAGAREGEAFERVLDRSEAIGRAVALAGEGDLVLVAGKGHESTIERADGAHPWDDRAASRAAIEARFGG